MTVTGTFKLMLTVLLSTSVLGMQRLIPTHCAQPTLTRVDELSEFEGWKKTRIVAEENKRRPNVSLQMENVRNDHPYVVYEVQLNKGDEYEAWTRGNAVDEKLRNKNLGNQTSVHKLKTIYYEYESITGLSEITRSSDEMYGALKGRCPTIYCQGQPIFFDSWDQVTELLVDDSESDDELTTHKGKITQAYPHAELYEFEYEVDGVLKTRVMTTNNDDYSQNRERLVKDGDVYQQDSEWIDGKEVPSWSETRALEADKLRGEVKANLKTIKEAAARHPFTAKIQRARKGFYKLGNTYSSKDRQFRLSGQDKTISFKYTNKAGETITGTPCKECKDTTPLGKTKLGVMYGEGAILSMKFEDQQTRDQFQKVIQEWICAHDQFVKNKESLGEMSLQKTIAFELKNL